MSIRYLWAILLFASSAGVSANEVQLATNMIWCYQNKGHKATQIETHLKYSDNKTNGKYSHVETSISRSVDEYVRDMQIAAYQGDALMAAEIYKVCHRHSTGRGKRADALKYANGATSTNWIKAVRHAAACYSPSDPPNSHWVRCGGDKFKSPYGEIECVWIGGGQCN